ncbi:hypothetical protein B0H15DRAFT_847247 [Mycena belliarum]|uniref:Uncharacterized protein n=1 Tax=Mycena belliarum TaxID=1033014 RepID=A0AAD6U2U5_9AGAR|nr:hypothetical protein B0H15DRAFT_847247 [Mycena belliae]
MLINEVRLQSPRSSPFAYRPLFEQSIRASQFPVRPHWTKNTHQIFGQALKALKNLDKESVKRFAAVHAQFDPQHHRRDYWCRLRGFCRWTDMKCVQDKISRST